jgi:hypothetical protein
MKESRSLFIRTVVIAMVCLSNTLSRPATADPVIDWNRIAKNAVVDREPKSSVTGLVILAYMHGAIYDAVNAIDRQHVPYAWHPATLDSSASKEAAVTSAAYNVLIHALPSQSAYLNEVYTGSLKDIPDGDAKKRGIALGEEAAKVMLALRKADGFEASIPYTPSSGSGVWQPTPPGLLPAIAPWAARLRPFTLTSPWQFRADGPTSLNSVQWVKDYHESKIYGAAEGSRRTPAQTELGRFWTEHSLAQYSRIWRDLATAQGLSLAENARFFAMLSIGAVDAIIAVFDSKYHYNFWRPVTAIRAGETDGNPKTEPDRHWSSAQITPNHPEYPAGHPASAGVFAQIIEAFFGTRRVRIVLSSAVTGTSYTIENTEELPKSVSDARVFGGMHYRTSCQEGVAMGRKVGRWLCQHYFRPVNADTSDRYSLAPCK